MLPRTHIMLHHSRTSDGTTVEWGAIRRHHMDRGLDAIGYHYGVELVGDHFEVLLGRSELEQAVACPQDEMNACALHVCCIGDFDQAPPPHAMLEALMRLVILPAMVEYGLPPERIIGHREVDSTKTCPGSQFDLDVVRVMSQQTTGNLAEAERWHHMQVGGLGPLIALRRVAPGSPSREELASRLGWSLEALTELESSFALPADAQVPTFARALGVSEHKVLETFTLVAMDFHRQRLAEASARLGALHASSPKSTRRAA